MITKSSEGIELNRIMAGESHHPLVYFLLVGDRVKIGTSTNLRNRVSAMSMSMKDVVLIIPGGADVERELHRKYAKHRIHPQREWFNVRGGLYCLLARTELPPTPDPLSPDVDEPRYTLTAAVREGIITQPLSSLRTAKWRAAKLGKAWPGGPMYTLDELRAIVKLYWSWSDITVPESTEGSPADSVVMTCE